jgi:hypothetical protein
MWPSRGIVGEDRGGRPRRRGRRRAARVAAPARSRAAPTRRRAGRPPTRHPAYSWSSNIKTTASGCRLARCCSSPAIDDSITDIALSRVCRGACPQSTECLPGWCGLVSGPSNGRPISGQSPFAEDAWANEHSNTSTGSLPSLLGKLLREHLSRTGNGGNIYSLVGACTSLPMTLATPLSSGRIVRTPPRSTGSRGHCRPTSGLGLRPRTVLGQTTTCLLKRR